MFFAFRYILASVVLFLYFLQAPAFPFRRHHPAFLSRPRIPALPCDKSSPLTIIVGYHRPIGLSSENAENGEGFPDSPAVPGHAGKRVASAGGHNAENWQSPPKGNTTLAVSETYGQLQPKANTPAVLIPTPRCEIFKLEFVA